VPTISTSAAQVPSFSLSFAAALPIGTESSSSLSVSVGVNTTAVVGSLIWRRASSSLIREISSFHSCIADIKRRWRLNVGFRADSGSSSGRPGARTNDGVDAPFRRHRNVPRW